MSDDFTRSITFEIPGSKNSPAVQVKAVEVDGSLAFTVNVMSTSTMTADLRGLFFNFNSSSKLAGLKQNGSHVTGFDTGDVIDLGAGVNMKGAASSFDVGIAFGKQGIGSDDIRSTTFTLSNSSSTLTLDDIANVEFGARLTSIGKEGGARDGSSKLLMTAPAAPDAHNDAFTIFEDGQQGLHTPATLPVGQIFQVLANDSDADGDPSTITAVKGAEHGTVQIVDGADADLLAGDAVLYTPYGDFSGTDSFQYSISDNHGGTDFATVDVGITAVADIPDLTYEVLAGEQVNQIVVRVTATQTDADNSEFIDSITLSGAPDGVQIEGSSYDPAEHPGQITRDFLITLPTGHDTNFDLVVSAVSMELSNGDTETANLTLPVSFDYTSNDYALTFLAEDQSIWSTGAEAAVSDDRFIDLVDEEWNKSGGSTVYYSTDGTLHADLHSKLELTAGGIEASVPYDISIETNYNKTTDVLEISSTAAITSGAAFDTVGPGGSYGLDLIFQLSGKATAGLDIELDDVEIVGGSLDTTLQREIVDVASTDLSYEYPLDYGVSLIFSWPNINTTSAPSSTNIFTSSDESNNFLQLNLDVDDLVFDLLGIDNPLDVTYDLEATWGKIEILDLDLWGGLNLTQDFTMTVNGLPGVITYEDGTSAAFVFGKNIVLNDASSYDQNGDGKIDFSLALDPEVTLQNETGLGVNFGYSFNLFKLDGEYDVVVDSDEYHVGPLYSQGDDVTIPLVGLYDSTFDLTFDAQSVAFAA